MCQRSFKFFVLLLYFYRCVDLSRDFGGYSTQSDNCCIVLCMCQYAGSTFPPDKVQPDLFCG